MQILLDKIMRDRNLTLRQVSVITGIPKSTIFKIANNKIMPRMDTMESLAKGLKIKIIDLFSSAYK